MRIILEEHPPTVAAVARALEEASCILPAHLIRGFAESLLRGRSVLYPPDDPSGEPLLIETRQHIRPQEMANTTRSKRR